MKIMEKNIEINVKLEKEAEFLIMNRRMFEHAKTKTLREKFYTEKIDK